MKLHGWQEANVSAMVQTLAANGVCIDASGTGAGKTVMALHACKRLGRSAKVICPASVVPTWQEVGEACGVAVRAWSYEKVLSDANRAPKWSELTDEDRKRMAGAWYRRPARPTEPGQVKGHPSPSAYWSACKADMAAPIVLASSGAGPIYREIFQSFAVGSPTKRPTAPKARGGQFRFFSESEPHPEKFAFIFDEVHRCGSHNSQLSKLLKSAADGNFVTIGLSATLAESPTKMRALAYLTGLCDYSWEHFRAWCLVSGCGLDDWNGLKFHGGTRHIEKIRADMGEQLTGISTIAVPDFPRNNVFCLSLPCSTSFDDAVAEALEHAELEAEIELVALLRARQLAEWGMRKAIAELAKDAIERGESAVIFVNFRETGEWLSQKFNCVFVSGETTGERRQQCIDDFQTNKSRLFLTTLSDGISLHDLHGRARVSIVSPDWQALKLVQRLGRICRTGAVSPAVQYVVFPAGSQVGDNMRKRISAKVQNLETLTDNDLTLLQQ